MIYAIADLHLDITKEKDMNVFGPNWDNYEERIFFNWKNIVTNDDLVLLPGDISWAMRVEEARLDLERIDLLQGKKIILKGNHDYWWSSLNKLNNLNLNTISFLQNNAFVYKGIRIVGTRGWLSRDSQEFTDQDEKIFKRELERLKLSLEYNLDEDYNKTIAIMHYPPFDKDLNPNEFEEIFKENRVDTVIYGHIHGEYAFKMPEGVINGIKYYCVSSDKVDFIPILIEV